MRNSLKVYQKNFESYLKMNKNIDRRVKEPGLEPIDAIMLTLDAEKYLGKTLDATYHELPFELYLAMRRISRIYKKYSKIVNRRELLLC